MTATHNHQQVKWLLKAAIRTVMEVKALSLTSGSEYACICGEQMVFHFERFSLIAESCSEFLVLWPSDGVFDTNATKPLFSYTQR